MVDYDDDEMEQLFCFKLNNFKNFGPAMYIIPTYMYLNQLVILCN